METEDYIEVIGSSNSVHGSENDAPFASDHETKISQQLMDEITEEDNSTIPNGLHDSMETSMTTEKEADGNVSAPQVCVELLESVKTVEKATSIGAVHAENVSVAVQSEISISNHEKDESLLSRKKKATNSISGVKRPRMTVEEQEPTVHVTYSSLPRESKQKLEELLQQWSQWHSQSCSSSHDADVILESGEETYFPALRVGLDKPSSVAFWVDNHTKIQSNKEFVPLDGTSVPLYDRGYSLALTSADGSSSMDVGEGLDTSRCFNCGSYSHALRKCPKPRNNAAVNNARKQHKSRKNQHANSRNSTRYYQSPQGGKYDGLTPGVLHAETRQLLGIGELEPPPWLNRMRELGYPPGYLDLDEEDQPSGLTIFGDEEMKDEQEEGEILEADFTEPSKKMTVKFPGLNAPIPGNADERLWAPTGPSSSYQPRDHSRRYNNYSSENASRRQHHSEHNRWSRDLDYSSENASRWQHHSEHTRWSRDLDDDGPPGCEPGTSPSLSYHFRRYRELDSVHTSRSPQDSPSTPWSPTNSRYFRHR